jgi:hypothetical protein
LIEKFEEGEKEKHFIAVNWNLASKRMTDELDGQTLFNKRFVFFSVRKEVPF